MIKTLFLDDFELLCSIYPKLKSKKNYLTKHQKEIEILGYFSGNCLKSFVIFRKVKKYRSNTVTIYEIGSINKYSLLKLFIYSTSSINLKYTKLHLPIRYKEEFKKIFDFKLLNLNYSKNSRYITILDISYNSDTLTIHSKFYQNDFIEAYKSIRHNISNKEFLKNRKKIISSYFRKKMLLLNEIDKNDKITVVTYKSKMFFNNGEINYTKVLEENGFIEVPRNTHIFNQNSYVIGEKGVTKNNKPVCELTIYTLKEFNVSKSKYRNTPNFYRNMKKFISNNLNKSKYNYFILDSDNRIFMNSIYLKPLDNIYLNCLNLNNIYIEEIKEIYNKYDMQESFTNLSRLEGSILQLKRIIGKEKTTEFVSRYFKSLSKSKAQRNFHHDNFIIYYVEVIYSPYLTKKAMTKIMDLPFNKIKEYVKLQIKFESFSIDTKTLRKRLSHYIKCNKDLNDLYEDLLIIKTKEYVGDVSKEDLKETENFIKELNNYSMRLEEINSLYFFSTFKENSLKVVKNKVPCIFNEYIMDNRTKKIGAFIKKLLGSRKENIKGTFAKSTKLYNDLRKIYNVDKLIKGDFPVKYINKIIKALEFRNIVIPNELFYWSKIERKCSPEYLMAGNITNCCMNFGSRKAIDYALEKGFGIISIYEDNTIVSNSVIWIHEDYNLLVLDNIEAISRVWKKDKIIKEEYLKITNYIKEKYKLKHIVQGVDYNDILICDEDISKDEKDIKIHQNGLEIEEKFYSDAGYIYPLSLKEYDEIKAEIKVWKKEHKKTKKRAA